MAQLFELLKGKIDVSKYEEEQKLEKDMKKLNNELERLSAEIFSNSIGKYVGEYSYDDEIRLKKARDLKLKEIEEFKKLNNIIDGGVKLWVR